MVYTVFYKTSSFAGYCFLDKNSIHPKRYGVFSFKTFKAVLVKIQICSFIVQYVFIAQIVENMPRLDDDEFKKLYGTDLTVENLIQAIESEMGILAAGTRKSATDLAVELWVYDALEDEKYFKERKQYFDTSKYITQLVKDEDIKQLMEIYLKGIWKDTDRTLNNYVHGNGRKYILDNYPLYGDYQKRKQKLIETVRDITSIFISILSIALPNKIQSSDYRDDMEFGITPRE